MSHAWLFFWLEFPARLLIGRANLNVLGYSHLGCAVCWATAYRIVISIVGCYIAARLAPNRAMGHALVLGVIGVVDQCNRDGGDMEPRAAFWAALVSAAVDRDLDSVRVDWRQDFYERRTTKQKQANGPVSLSPDGEGNISFHSGELTIGPFAARTSVDASSVQSVQDGRIAVAFGGTVVTLSTEQ